MRDKVSCHRLYPAFMHTIVRQGGKQDVSEQVERALQQSGKRITQQRKILLDVILNGEWECCKEIYYEAVKRDSSIGMATVYRMMTTLEEIGVIERRCVFRVKDEIEL